MSIRTLSIAIICSLLAYTAAGQEFGLQLYSLRNQLKDEVPGTLALVKSWGIKELEGGSTYGMTMDWFQKVLRQNGLKVVSVGADFNELADDPKKAIDLAKAFGAKFVTCTWIPHRGDTFTIDDVKKALEVFTAAGQALAAEGISLCYHPHGYEFRPYLKGTLFDYMVKNSNPKYMNFEMDVFWIKHPGQDPVALLRKYPKRFLLMHLKDRRPGTEGNQNGHADVESNVVLGQGDVGIAAVMKAARKAGVRHYFIEDESSRSVDQIPQSLEYLKSLEENPSASRTRK